MEAYTHEGIPVHRFDSASEFANAAKPYASGSSHWTGSTAAEAYDACTIGDLSCVADAEMLIEKISANVETTRSVWEPAVAGTYPIVPDYLTGHPLNMRRRTHVTNENAPIKIYLDLTSSAGVDSRDLAKRGIAFLALAMLLTRSRPVEMHVFTALGSHPDRSTGSGDRSTGSGLISFQLPTAPLDLALAGGVFTKGIARTLGYEYLAKVLGTGPGWLRNLSPTRPETMRAYVALARAALRAGPEDIIIGPVYYTDDSINNPVKFVQKMIDLHAKGESE